MANHKIEICINGVMYDTLEDILPVNQKLKLLFIAKVPTPDSVAAEHYFQGSQGVMLWDKLKTYGILNIRSEEKEDDQLNEQGCGIIDMVRKPQYYSKEPRAIEYKVGVERVINIIKNYKPKAIIFVYKKVLDKVLQYNFDYCKKEIQTQYGFNYNLENLFGCRVFVFPMPGTPCRRGNSHIYMTELKEYINSL